MKEKKQFFIPKNYDKKFEWIPGIAGWQHLAFIPVAGFDFLFLKYTSFSVSNKVLIALVSVGLPWVLIGTHPIRENVPLYKHLYWRIKFLTRQRLFHYKKEGYINESIQEIEIKSAKSNGSKKAASSNEKHSRLDSLKRDRERIADHARKQNGSMPKSIGN